MVRHPALSGEEIESLQERFPLDPDEQRYKLERLEEKVARLRGS